MSLLHKNRWQDFLLWFHSTSSSAKVRVGPFEALCAADAADGIAIEEANMDAYRWKKNKIGVSFASFYVSLLEHIWILLPMWILFETVPVIWKLNQKSGIYPILLYEQKMYFIPAFIQYLGGGGLCVTKFAKIGKICNLRFKKFLLVNNYKKKPLNHITLLTSGSFWTRSWKTWGGNVCSSTCRSCWGCPHSGTALLRCSTAFSTSPGI